MDGAAKVYAEPISVRERLYRLGVAEDDLRTAIEYGHRQAASCTAHDPPTAAGYIAWAKATRAFRALSIPVGWTTSNARGYPITVHSSGEFAVVVAGGDANTGIEHLTPATRSAKGPATRDAIDENQLSFYTYMPEVFGTPPVLATHNPRMTWVLLHYRDGDAGVIRAELSLPTDMTAEGFVGTWRERIILREISFGPGGGRDIEPDGDSGGEDTGEIDIPIGRKAAS